MKLYKRKNSDTIYFRVGDDMVSSLKLFRVKLYWSRKDDVRLAEELIRKHGEEQLLEKTGFLVDKCPSIPLAEAFESYKDTGRLGKADSTCSRENEAMLQILRYTDAVNIKHLNELDERVIQSYQAFRLRMGVKSSSVNRETNTIRVFLRFCLKRKWILGLPVIDKLPEDKPVPQVISIQDYRAMVNRAQEEGNLPVYRYLVLSGYLIARPGEILSLVEGDINWSESYVKITRKKTSRSGIPVTLFPMHGDLERELHKWNLTGHEDAHLLPSGRTGGCYSLSGFRHIWTRFLKKSGFRPVPLKIMRASSESWLLQATGDIKLVATLAAHSVATAEKHYIHVNRSYLEKGVMNGQSGLLFTAETEQKPSSNHNIVHFPESRNKL